MGKSKVGKSDLPSVASAKEGGLKVESQKVNRWCGWEVGEMSQLVIL